MRFLLKGSRPEDRLFPAGIHPCLARGRPSPAPKVQSRQKTKARPRAEDQDRRRARDPVFRQATGANLVGLGDTPIRADSRGTRYTNPTQVSRVGAPEWKAIGFGGQEAVGAGSVGFLSAFIAPSDREAKGRRKQRDKMPDKPEKGSEKGRSDRARSVPAFTLLRSKPGWIADGDQPGLVFRTTDRGRRYERSQPIQRRVTVT